MFVGKAVKMLWSTNSSIFKLSVDAVYRHAPSLVKEGKLRAYEEKVAFLF